MANRVWDFYRDITDLRREIDRAFEAFGIDGGPFWPFSRISFLPGRAARVYPLLNLSEDADNLYVEALAPGVDPETLDVSLVRNQLTLSGEKKAALADAKPEDYHRSERGIGKFVRSITLPVDVEENKIKADYRNGLLLITLPKAEEAKPKQIAVKVG